jgi:VCBS repeat-containing protein
VTTVNGVQTSLLANDTHPTGAPLSMGTTAFPGPAHGSVTLNSNGTFSYTHNGDAAVSDEFVYRVCVTTNANACSHQRVALTITQLADAIFANGYE